MTMTPDPQKVDRDEVFLEYTKSICPVCKTVIDGEVNLKDNKVFLRKRCAEPRSLHRRRQLRPAADEQVLGPTTTACSAKTAR